MTDYERGLADGLRKAAEVCRKHADVYQFAIGNDYRTGYSGAADACETEILSLIPEGADQREAQQVSNNPPNATADPQSASHQNPGERAESPHAPDGQVGMPSNPILPPARPGPFVMVPREQWDFFVSDYNRYVDGDPSLPFYVLRISLAAMLHAAREEKRAKHSATQKGASREPNPLRAPRP